MTKILNARSFLSSAPREAIADVVGIIAIALMVFIGFTLPALI